MAEDTSIDTPPRAARAGTPALGRALLLVLALVLVGALPVEAATAPVVTAGASSSGAVALTFDDGTDRAACASIARTLRASHAKGTFFINGNVLRSAPAHWRRILRGQPVGNHTRSHGNLARLSDATIRRQIAQNEALHERILGRPMLKLLRPPYGSYDARVQRIAGDLGYRRVVLWNVDTFDWRPSSSVAGISARATGARPGSVILMHCNRAATAAALPGIIRHYRARGIRLVGLAELLNS